MTHAKFKRVQRGEWENGRNENKGGSREGEGKEYICNELSWIVSTQVPIILFLHLFECNISQINKIKPEGCMI